MRFVFFLLLMTSSLMAQNLRLDVNANQVEMEVFMLYIGQVSEHGDVTYDLHDLSSQSSFDLPYASSLVFGVDSVTQVLSSYEGVLDPLEGMYWTWQTGYIHCKLEGNIICDSSRKSFEYHIGGYSTNDSGPFFIGHKSIGNELQVTLDIYPAIQWAMKKEVFRIMSPGKLSDQMAQAILNGISIR